MAALVTSRPSSEGIPIVQLEGSSKLVAAAMGLAGFAVALIAGLHAGNPSATILTNAILALVVCNFVGLMLGSVGERVIRDHVAALRPASGAGPIGAAQAKPGGGTASAGDA